MNPTEVRRLFREHTTEEIREYYYQLRRAREELMGTGGDEVLRVLAEVDSLLVQVEEELGI